ncbi:hypothetical protein TTHERM_00411590 (macronuclear) [Tetrahymena thermophila SB210]|uniref:Uncharacterized protein n=1 Tax=Tetrahymena thermophila (strain SB210) TaxID=312017 RepID=I7M2K1_TETTS|nr:hypothetical protein TTHERM_00411590 [Tetrahymena thermophila SB210]EAS00608.1 hypothetical protein TTHERM_00411590 [Tetrahymena thermophila SB210]|eukprot:XP_001020853.1 hypothetical protein TTHERM_00411590 [Tetrahymena thermophila SB210]
MLPQNYLLPSPQSNLLLINNQQIHNVQILPKDIAIHQQTERSMTGTPYNAFDYMNANLVNTQNPNSTTFNNPYTQQSNFKGLYPSNYCVNTYLNNFNSNISNNNFLTNQIYANQLINHSVGIAQPQGFLDMNEKAFGVNQSLVGLPNHYSQQQLVQLHPNKQQFEFKQSQSSGIFQIAPDQQTSNLCSGYITQFQMNQPRSMPNYDSIKMNKQLMAETVFNQGEIQQNAQQQQYPSNLIHQNFLQSQNTFSPNSLSNYYPEQQSSTLNQCIEQTAVPPFIQPQSQCKNLNILQSNQDSQFLLKQQSNDLNQLALNNNQISQKTANSQQSSSYQDELNEIQMINYQARYQSEVNQFRNRYINPAEQQEQSRKRAFLSIEKVRDIQKDQAKLSNQESAFSSQIIINQDKIQIFESKKHQIKKSEEEEKEELQQIQPKQQKQKKQSQNKNQNKQSVGGNSQKHIQQSTSQSSIQAYNISENNNNQCLIQQQDKCKFNQDNQNQSQKKLNCNSTKDDNLQLTSLSSSSISYNNQDRQYAYTQEQKSNKSYTQSSISKENEQRNHVEVFVDSRKRSTSIDHSAYLQLYNLLADKKVIDEFTDLIQYRGIENIDAQNLNNQISDFNSPSFKSGKYQEIKKYKQLLNQTFVEIKFSNQPFQIVRYDSKEDQQLKIEESDDSLEYKLTNLTSFNKKTEKVNQIVESIETAILSRIPLLFKEEKILESLSLIPSGQYQVYSNLQNMCIQFVRGEKRKRFKERNKDSQYMSRFHNLNRLFFYQIMSMYSYEALSCFLIDPNISEQLRNIISCIKIHSKLQLITQKSKQSDNSTNNLQNPLASQTTKTEKRKRSYSQKDNQELEDNLDNSAKKIMKIDTTGDHHSVPPEAEGKISLKKQQKISEKNEQKSQIITNFYEAYGVSQQNNQSLNSSLHFTRQESHSISTQDNQSRKRASTAGEYSKTICEQNIFKDSDQKISKLSHYHCENSELISQTPSPVNTIFKSLSQKGEASKTSTSNNELDANQVTAKKYSSLLSHLDNVNSEVEENTGQTLSNAYQKEQQATKSQKQQLRFKKVQKIESSSLSCQQEENSKESDVRVQEKYNIDEGCEVEVEEDEEDEDKDFPIKNFKKYYRILKVENYTHSHYNTLFLKLNASSMEYLKKQPKDVDSHWLAYKIDLRDPQSIPQEKIKFVNTMKSLFYKIFVHFNNFSFTNKEDEQTKILNNIANDPNQPIPKDSQEFKQIQLRLDYYLRVVQGISKLNQGMYSHKF